jgi:hypothetical protein
VITDEDFRDIAAAAYKVDPLWTNPPWKRGQGIPPSDPRYAIIEEPVNDPATGFQAITVAPLKPNSKVDTDPSQVYVAFAGTNPAHHADINTDAQAVIAGKVSATQTEQAKETPRRSAPSTGARTSPRWATHWAATWRCSSPPSCTGPAPVSTAPTRGSS